MLPLGASEILGPHDRIRSPRSPPRVRIATHLKKRAVEFEVGAKHRLGVAQLDRAIVPALRGLDDLRRLRRWRQRHSRSRRALQDLAYSVDLLHLRASI